VFCPAARKDARPICNKCLAILRANRYATRVPGTIHCLEAVIERLRVMTICCELQQLCCCGPPGLFHLSESSLSSTACLDIQRFLGTTVLVIHPVQMPLVHIIQQSTGFRILFIKPVFVTCLAESNNFGSCVEYSSLELWPLDSVIG